MTTFKELREQPWMIRDAIHVRKRVLLAAIPLIAVLLFIWGNSVLSGIDSYKLTIAIFGELSLEERFFVRNLAHFVEFFALGFVMNLILRNPSIALFAGLAVAVIDEYIQLFSPGRTAELKDVLIDFIGVLVAVCLIQKRKTKG